MVGSDRPWPRSALNKRQRSPTAASRLRTTASAPADAGGVLLILVLTLLASWNLLRGGQVIGLDSSLQFYPRFSFLGERLRAGDIPGWNPYQFGGTPFAGDPESGWMYLPAMLLFTALPLAAAIKGFVFFHMAFAGVAMYALARVLGIRIPGALVAAVAYAFSGYFYDRSVCCFAHVEVAAWVPLVLLGVELAMRSGSWLARCCWWGAAGLALSQPLVAWLGQGAYYALLALAGYTAYRALFAPVDGAKPFRDRLLALVLHGGAVLLIGFGFAAAGVLPQLEYNARSSLAGGYGGDAAWAAVVGGWTPGALDNMLLRPGGWYAGGATVALAFVALVVARGRFAVAYFAVLSLSALFLTQTHTTPLHSALYRLLPRFEEVHRHYPERVVLIVHLGLAFLAGAAVDALKQWRRPALLVFIAGLPILGALLLTSHGAPIPRSTLYAVVFAGLVVSAFALLPIPALQRLVPVLLLGVVFGDLLAAARWHADHGIFFAKVDLAAYYDPMGAGRFLRSQREDQPFRFFGYDPQLEVQYHGWPALYRYQFADPRAAALVVNNRATLLGLQDIQGYNPLQLARFVEYMKALNGEPQEYHGAYVFPEGLDSPLLDLLNVRYVVVPASWTSDRSDLRRLEKEHATVYADDQIKVLENREAYPRAWIVHDARQVAPGEALRLLVSGAVNPRRTALLEEEPPLLAPPGNTAADRAVVVSHEADRLRLRVSSDASGLLVLSEIYDPAWKAYLDGKPVPLFAADHALRAVPVGPGEHAVELRYESRALRAGIAISLIFLATLGGLVAAAGWRKWRSLR